MAEDKGLLADQELPPSYESAAQPLPVDAGAPAPPRTTGSRPPFPLELPALSAVRTKRVVLASASPRRKQLLAQIGLHNLHVHPSGTPEDLPKSLSPFEYVLETATQKALAVYKDEVDHPDFALLIAADTVVVSSDGKILEKPRNEKEHISMLKALRGGPGHVHVDVDGVGNVRGEAPGADIVPGIVLGDAGGWHKVFTAVAVMTPLESGRAPGYALETAVEETAVKFDQSVTDDLIKAYVRTREGADKAGGYGIQGIGTILVERIEGSFDNVVGLPLRATLQLIEKVLVFDEEMDEHAARALDES